MAEADRRVQAILEAGEDPFMLLVRHDSCNPGVLTNSHKHSHKLLTEPPLYRSCLGQSWMRLIGPSGTWKTLLSRDSTVGCADCHGGGMRACCMSPHDAIANCVVLQLSLCCHPDKNQTEDAARAFHRECLSRTPRCSSRFRNLDLTKCTKCRAGPCS